MSILQEIIKDHIAKNPCPNLSGIDLFQDRDEFVKYKDWARSHPLFNKKVKLNEPIPAVSETGKIQEVTHVTLLELDETGRFWAQHGSNFYWICPGAIDLKSITLKNLIN